MSSGLVQSKARLAGCLFLRPRATLVDSSGITDLFAVAFDTATSSLYAAAFTGSGPFYQLNTTTGAASPIGSGIGDRLGATAYNSNANVLLALSDCLSCAKLYSVNPATGAGTLVLSTGLDTNNSGMTYYPTTNLFWDVDVSGRLSFFDPSNGYAQTPVTTFGFSFNDLAYVPSLGAPTPEPASWSLCLGALAAGFMLRRRISKR